MAQEIQSALQASQPLKLLPEEERTGYYDEEVAPLVEQARASVRPDDPDSLANGSRFNPRLSAGPSRASRKSPST